MSPDSMRVRANINGKPYSCSFCMIHKVGLCSARGEVPYSKLSLGSRPIAVSRHTIRGRQIILHPKELCEFVIFICSGQAVSSVGLSDGRRQILEFLLPGDMVLWTALLEPIPGRLIEAIDNSEYRRVRHDEFQSLLFEWPDLLEKFVLAFTQEKRKSDQLALTLGRRSAAERIAGLILSLADRLGERGLMAGQTMRFPLRLRHIGDATGLTPVHASKILSQLQRANIISLQSRFLTINDLSELRQIAGCD